MTAKLPPPTKPSPSEKKANKKKEADVENYKSEVSEKCVSCYLYCSTFMTRLLEAFFHKFGGLVGLWPWTTLCLSLLVCGIFSSGFSKFYASNDDEFLWTPYGSAYVDQKAWIAKNFPKDTRYESIMISDKVNVLTTSHMKYLYNIQEAVKNVTSPKSGKNFDQLCLKDRPGKDGKCIFTSLLQIWSNDKEKIWNLTQDQLLLDITSALSNPDQSDQLAPLLSNVKRQEPPSRMAGGNYRGEDGDAADGVVVSAEALMAVWIMKHNGVQTPGGLFEDKIAEDWEASFVNLLVNPKNLDLNGNSVEGKPASSQLDVLVESSFINGIDATVESNSITLYAGGVFLLAFTCSVLGKFNSLEQRVVLSLCGLVVIGLAIGSSFGLCFYMGLFYADMHPMIPFLMLGIGVDDMFVIVKALDNLSKLDKQKPVPTRIGLAMKHAGVSITVTSMTNMFSFLIGGTSSLPIVRCFCIFCGMGILFLYFFSVTFFVACLTLDEKRIDKRKPVDLPFVKPKPMDWVPNKFSQIEFGNIVFGRAIANVIFKTPCKIVVLLVTFGLFGTAIYGATKLETNYNPILYMDSTQYQVQFYHNQEKYFPGQGERTDIYVGHIDYYKHPNELMRIEEAITALPSVRADSFDFWFSSFYKQFCENDKSSCDTEKGFDYKLVSFFSQSKNWRYLNDMKIEGDGSDGKFPRITASRATFQHINLATTSVQNVAVKSVKDAMANITFPDEEFKSPIAYCFTYVQWTANELMSNELVRNLSLNFGAVMALTIVFLPNPQLVFLCLCCVVFTVGNVAGFSYFLGLTIEIITVINLILSVGLAIDYCAHLAVTYACCQEETTRQTKARKALAQVGSAVFNGGLSTFLAFLMVAFSPSYVYTTFFKMFALVALFGLYHGLIFLPVALSLIGPQDVGAKDNQDLKNEEDDKTLEGHVNWSFKNNNEDDDNYMPSDAPPITSITKNIDAKIPMTQL